MIENNSKKEHNIIANSPEKLYLTKFFQIFNISFICINSNKGEFRFRPIRAFVYLLALSQSERVHCYYFRFRRVFQYENYGCK